MKVDDSPVTDPIEIICEREGLGRAELIKMILERKSPCITEGSAIRLFSVTYLVHASETLGTRKARDLFRESMGIRPQIPPVSRRSSKHRRSRGGR